MFSHEPSEGEGSARRILEFVDTMETLRMSTCRVFDALQARGTH